MSMFRSPGSGSGMDRSPRYGRMKERDGEMQRKLEELKLRADQSEDTTNGPYSDHNPTSPTSRDSYGSKYVPLSERTSGFSPTGNVSRADIKVRWFLQNASFWA